VVRKGYNAKIKKYFKWDHEGHIIPLTFDSAGDDNIEMFLVSAATNDENLIEIRW